ncbi:MAG TPA: hypothetical protein VFE60_26525 [Roseiarcus sp.]|jgi:hypothetical protein|nr:hypothetical protein [Roseiarcus sp.]
MMETSLRRFPGRLLAKLSAGFRGRFAALLDASRRLDEFLSGAVTASAAPLREYRMHFDELRAEVASINAALETA